MRNKSKTNSSGRTDWLISGKKKTIESEALAGRSLHNFQKTNHMDMTYRPSPLVTTGMVVDFYFSKEMADRRIAKIS